MNIPAVREGKGILWSEGILWRDGEGSEMSHRINFLSYDELGVIIFLPYAPRVVGRPIAIPMTFLCAMGIVNEKNLRDKMILI